MHPATAIAPSRGISRTPIVRNDGNGCLCMSTEVGRSVTSTTVPVDGMPVRYAVRRVSGSPRLSDGCTLLIPVDPSQLDVLPQSAAAALGMVRKSEHHVTVFGSEIGRGLREATAELPRLRAVIDAVIDASDLTWRLPDVPRLVRLHRPAPRELQTVIVMVDAPGIAAFFAACAERLPAIAPATAAMQWEPPPPHITLLTTDPHGAEGIGLRGVAELDEAERRGAAGDTTGLRAFAFSVAEGR